MGAFLERGQMITGRYGRRYMVKNLLQDNGRFQIYEFTESGKPLWGVVLSKGSNRFKVEFVEKAADGMIKAKEFAWPIDVINFDIQNKKMFGYVLECDASYRPLENTKDLSAYERFKVGYGIAKSFSKMHIQGCVYSEVPSVWCNSDFEVKLIAVPLPAGSKFAKDDILGLPGINAPEMFAVAAVKQANMATDRFLLASLLFMMFTGIKPYIASIDVNYAYARFVFDDDKEVLIEKYGHSVVERWEVLGEGLQEMFKKTFKDGVTNAEVRYDTDDWAYKIQDQMDLYM